MKKSLSRFIAFALSIGITTSVSAQQFSDVPKDHWSYEAINQLVKDGVIEGYNDGTYAGDRSMSRYEMAMVVAKAMNKLSTVNPADQALIEKLQNEYLKELSRLDDKYDKLDKRVDNVMLSGFVRAKYDSDKSGGYNNNNNKHFYMNLEGKMKVSEQWSAHFQSETRKGYTANQSWRDNGSSDDQDGTFQRIWVEGKNGAVNITAGKKWWGYGFQNVAFGHAAEGIQLDYNFTPTAKVSAFALRPSQGALVSMGDGTPASNDVNIHGLNLQGSLGHNLDANLVIAFNNDKDIQKMSRWGSLDLRTKLAKDLTLTGTYSRTNADEDNNSTAIRLDYKGADITKIGSWGMYARYVKFGRYGDASHDDEWSSLPQDMKGWILGVTYVPYKNVKWETFYSQQSLNISGKSTGDYNYGHGAIDKDQKRNLFRTQLDFYF